jgi:hypothetical protein
MDDRLLPLLRDQYGVVARRQALMAGLTRENLDRLCRRNELTRLHPRVYLDHTGEPTWDQCAWGAVLWGWPAALTHGSALAVVEGPRSPHRVVPVEIAVTRDRRLSDEPGIAVHRSDHVRARTQPGSPPRIRYDEAVLDVVARIEDVDGLVAELGRVLQARRTTPTRLATALQGRPWIRHRAVLEEILADVKEGATSALERTYVRDVERAHGLPRAARQLHERSLDGTLYRDNLYEVDGRVLVVELDGRQFHDTARQRDRDLDRDLLTLLQRAARTARLGWGQCRGRPCRTAGLLGALLRDMGWGGEVQPCRPGCEAPSVFRRAVPERPARLP